MKLSQIIKEYRSLCGMTMQDFANKSGLSKGYVSMLESGKNPRSGKPTNACSPECRKELRRIVQARADKKRTKRNRKNPPQPN